MCDEVVILATRWASRLESVSKSLQKTLKLYFTESISFMCGSTTAISRIQTFLQYCISCLTCITTCRRTGWISYWVWITWDTFPADGLVAHGIYVAGARRNARGDRELCSWLGTVPSTTIPPSAGIIEPKMVQKSSHRFLKF